MGGLRVLDASGVGLGLGGFDLTGSCLGWEGCDSCVRAFVGGDGRTRE